MDTGVSLNRVLYVAADRKTAETTAAALEDTTRRFAVNGVVGVDVGLNRLADDDDIDCVVSEYALGERDGVEFLRTAREASPNLPFVLYPRRGSEAVASAAVSAGATDYLPREEGEERYELLAERVVEAVSQAWTERAGRYMTELAEATDRSLFVFDRDWSELLFINGAYEDIWGRSVEALKEEPTDFLRVVHPDDRDPVKAAMGRVAAGEGEELEFRVNAEEGYERWVRARTDPVTDDAGDVVRLVGYVTDVTEQRRQRLELEQLRERFERFAETVPEAFFLVSADYSETQYVNAAVERLYGITPAEAHDDPKSWLRHVHPEDKAALLEEMNAQQEETISWPVEQEYRVQHPERGLRWLNVQMNRIDDDEPQLAGVASDVTERKERERELREERDRLDELAGVISHDLRSPLNVAQGRLELLREDCDSDHVDPIDGALTQMDELVEDVLALAREAESLGEVEPVELGTVARACRDAIDGDATVEITVDRTVPADRSRLRRLFENLYRNAVEHGGDAPTVTVGGLSNGFYVEDDGPGIPEDERETVFVPGYSTADNGTGFGLGIVERIAEAHGWEVRVTDGADGGARFEVTGVEGGDSDPRPRPGPGT
ncbi:MAG: PAS domain-containing protein [Halolamina sp.]